jgi:streptogramin lyase
MGAVEGTATAEGAATERVEAVIGVSVFATSGVTQRDLTAGPDGGLWFTVPDDNQVGRITAQGNVTLFAIPTVSSTPSGITAGPDGNLWFVETASDKLARIPPLARLPSLRCQPGQVPLGSQWDPTTPSGSQDRARAPSCAIACPNPI